MRTLHLQASDPAQVTQAASILRAGGLVAFPTETVYGLGANALNPQAVEKIFAAKQRPHWDPLIVHIAALADLTDIATLPSQALPLTQLFWPGPLTLLLPRTRAIPDAVTAGRPLVGIRIPAHPVALDLLRQTNLPIAAPSANRFGHTSPTTAQHVLEDLDGRIDAVLDAGPSEVGLESTVAELTPDGLIVYRPGAVTLAMLEDVLVQGTAQLHIPTRLPGPLESLPSPGVGLRHYAPRATLILVPIDPHSRTPIEQSLAESIDAAQTAESRIGVLLPEHWNRASAQYTFAWGPWGDQHLLAQRLFSGLRALDEAGATTILCPIPNGTGIAEAIRDRLEKAAKTA